MKKLLLSLSVAVALFVSCMMTSCQSCTRRMGGTTVINLEKGEKLTEATWKDDNIWYLVEPMEGDYVPKKKILKETSNTGLLEGQVIFIESK